MSNVVPVNSTVEIVASAERHALGAYSALIEHGHIPGTDDFRLLGVILLTKRVERFEATGELRFGSTAWRAWLRLAERSLDALIAARTGGAP